jgi:hypothetical protein
MTRSIAPVLGLRYRTFVQFRPPSVVLKTPRVSLSVHSWPEAATYTMFGFVGCTMMRPTVCVSVNPMCCHVRPAFVDL